MEDKNRNEINNNLIIKKISYTSSPTDITTKLTIAYQRSLSNGIEVIKKEIKPTEIPNKFINDYCNFCREFFKYTIDNVFTYESKVTDNITKSIQINNNTVAITTQLTVQPFNDDLDIHCTYNITTPFYSLNDNKRFNAEEAEFIKTCKPLLKTLIKTTQQTIDSSLKANQIDIEELPMITHMKLITNNKDN